MTYLLWITGSLLRDGKRDNERNAVSEVEREHESE